MDEDRKDTTAIARPAQRLRFTAQRKFSYSTALAYIMSKPEIDDEWRRMVEAIIETLVNREGIAGHPVDGLEVVSETMDGR